MMRYIRKMQLIPLLVGLVIGSGLMIMWWPVSAGVVMGDYTQYLPFVPVVNCVPGPPIPPDDIERDTAVETEINEIRDEYGLPRFANSQKITQAALRHSNDMADNNFFDHTGSDGSRAGDRLDEACYNWQAYGEIIAAGYRSSSNVVEAWMEGPGHRSIILDGELAEFGAGYAYNRSSKYKHYWTVDFGLLASESMTATGGYHTCSYHLEGGGGEMLVRLYTREPCNNAAGELGGSFSQE